MKHIITVSILFILSLLQTIQAKGKDEYWYTPKANPEERKESFLKYYAEHGRKDFLTGIFNQIARVAIGQPMEDEPTYKAVRLCGRVPDGFPYDNTGRSYHGVRRPTSI